jgi:hypothetical protein
MITKSNLKGPLLYSLIALFVLIANPELIAQDNKSTDLKDFKLVIETTESGIKMYGIKGSAWIDLFFSIKNDLPQAIDEYGMTRLDNVSSSKDSNLADFLFTITRTNNRIEIKGIEGTAWTDLSFSLAEDKKQAIDQNGMTKLN